MTGGGTIIRRMLSIRMATPADAPGVRAIYAPCVEATPISFELEPPSVDEMADRIAKTTAMYPWLVAIDGDTVAGYAYGGAFRTRPAYRWSVEVSAYVAESHRGRGVGRGLYEALFRILVAQGFCRAYAGITLPNAASVALHEAVGFTRVGTFHAAGYKFGAWHDVGWWERAVGDGLLENPQEPRPVGDVIASALE